MPGTLSAANFTVDGEELCISIFVKSQVRCRTEWTGTQLDAFGKMQRPARPQWLIFWAVGHGSLDLAQHEMPRLGQSISDWESKRVNVRFPPLSVISASTAALGAKRLLELDTPNLTASV